MTAAEIRDGLIKRKCRTGEYKSYREEDGLDNEIIKRLGVKPIAHPREMYKKKPWIDVNRTKGWVYERIEKPERIPSLPEKYTAIRFYGNDWTKKVPAVVTSCGSPTVNLLISEEADNHGNFDIEADLVIAYRPEESFRVLTQVVAHAETFVCTYGSMVTLGIVCGTPTVSLSQWDRTCFHDELERKVARELNVPFMRLNV